jgi:hypothetical protein
MPNELKAWFLMPTSLTQLINDLVWWAVEVQAQELQELAPAAGAST